MLLHLPCGRFVQEPNQRNLLELQMPPEVHHQPMWKRLKSLSMTIHHAIWEQLSLYCLLFWLFFVCFLPFTYTIITEVVWKSLCTGINNIKNHLRPTWQRQNQFQLSLRLIPLQHLIHQYHLRGQNDYRKHSTK